MSSNISDRQNNEDFIVEIVRPGCSDGNRYIRPAKTVLGMQRWCEEWNREASKSTPPGRTVRLARVIRKN